MATFNGSDAPESFTGDPVADTLSGGFGNDTLTGGAGGDLIYGEAAINPLTYRGTEVPPAGQTQVLVSMTVTNSTTDTLYIYGVDVSGSIWRIAAIAPGATYTANNVPSTAGRVIGNADGTEFYRALKIPTSPGNVTLTLNSANDLIRGDAGDDSLYGQVGADTIYGGDGRDLIEGGTGADQIAGEIGADVINAGDGNDSVSGGADNDTIGGGNGVDTIFGDGGLDVISGGSGNDQLHGGAENDYITGDGGNDQIFGDDGADTLDGSLGADTIQGGEGTDLISGGFGDDSLLGGAANDTISGDDGDDVIDGGGENDLLHGNFGLDTIDGGDGADVIEGGLSNDSIIGGGGNDTIYGNAETPTASGGDINISAGSTVTSNNVRFTNLDNPNSLASPQFIQTFEVDGQPYVIMSAPAFDGYVGVYRLENDGTLIRTGSMLYQDGSNGSPASVTVNGTNITSTLSPASLGAFGNAAGSVEVTELNGTTTLFINSQNGSGITAWEVNSSGGLVYRGALRYGDSQGYTATGGLTSNHEIYTADDGTVYVYASRGQTNQISRFEYDPATGTFTPDTGTFTPNTTFSQTTANSPGEILGFQTTAGDFMAVANGTGVQIFAVNSANGNLSLVSSATATTQSGLRAEVTVYTKPDGTIYLVYSNTNAEEVVLYEVGADGTLTHSDSLVGQGDFSRMFSNVSYINGEPVIVVPDVSGGAIRIYTISDNGSFVLETEIIAPWVTANPPIIVQSEDGTYYLVDAATGNTVALTITQQTGVDDDIIDGGIGDDVIFGQEGDDSLSGGADNDSVDGGVGDDTLLGNAGNDLLTGDDGDDRLEGGDNADQLSGGAGRDFLDGGAGADVNTGGEGFDTFVAGDGDTITDFNTATGQNFADGDQSNNDFVDLSGYYNQANLEAYNAQAILTGADTYGHPLMWLRADQMDNGILDEAGISLTIQGVTDREQLTYDNTNVPCFGSDALIRTASGEVRAAELSVGDLVETRDAGLQAIRWIGARSLDAATLAANPRLRPIRIRKDALGKGLPEADLIVSPQHRMLVRSKIAQKMFGTTEVLVAAKQLCQIEGIDVAEDLTKVTYVHFLFDAHQIVRSNGAESESLFTGTEALRSVGPSATAEIFALFPELARQDHVPVAARELVSGRMGRKLAVRHAQNAKPLVS